MKFMIQNAECELRKLNRVITGLNIISKNILKVKKAGGEDVVNIINSNENLLNYLQLLVEYVNLNPAILNKNLFKAKTVEAVGRITQSDLAKKLQIPMQRKPKQGFLAASLIDYNMLRSHMNVGVGIGKSKFRKQGLSPMGNPIASPLLAGPAAGMMLSPQFGGNLGIDTYFKKKKQDF